MIGRLILTEYFIMIFLRILKNISLSLKIFVKLFRIIKQLFLILRFLKNILLIFTNLSLIWGTFLKLLRILILLYEVYKVLLETISRTILSFQELFFNSH